MAKASGSIDLRPVKDASKVADNYLSFTESGGLNIGYTGKTERTNIKADGMRIYDSTSSTIPVASFLSTRTQIGKDGENRLTLTSSGQSLISDKNAVWFEIKQSGNPISDVYSIEEPDVNGRSTVTLTKTPESSRSLFVKVWLKLKNPVHSQGVLNYGNRYVIDTFPQAVDSTIKLEGFPTETSTQAVNSYCMATYNSSSNSVTLSDFGSNVTDAWFESVQYYVSSEAIDLGTFSFGSRRQEDITASGTASFGKGLVVSRPYQFVVGQYNERNDDLLFAIGMGTEYKPYNAFTVDKIGNVEVNQSLSIGGLLSVGDEEMSDWVITQATTGAWKWRKWHSGKIEAWTRWNVGTVAVTTASLPYGGYRSAGLALAIPSGIFTAAPFAVGVKSYSQGGWLAHIMASSATSIGAYIGSAASVTLTNQTIDVYAWQN